MSESNLRATTLSDGRVVYARTDRDGPSSLDLPVPGALGAVLSPLYRARIVVERSDGGALTDEDRAHLGDALDAVARHDALTAATDYVRGEMFVRRSERNDPTDTHDQLPQSPERGARSAA